MFSVENSGLTHVVVDAVRVRGLDAAGRHLFDHAVQGWYLLAQHKRDYDVPLSAGDCAAASLAVEVSIGKTVVDDHVRGPLTGCR